MKTTRPARLLLILIFSSSLCISETLATKSSTAPKSSEAKKAPKKTASKPKVAIATASKSKGPEKPKADTLFLKTIHVDHMPFSVPTKMPQYLKDDFRKRLKEGVEEMNRPITEKEIRSVRKYLRQKLRYMKIIDHKQDVEEIIKGIDEGSYERKITGPFLHQTKEIEKWIEEEAQIICQKLASRQKESKEFCEKKNKDLLLVNLILNSHTDKEPFNDQLRKLIFDTDFPLRDSK